MTGWPADWAAITCALMCSNCALRSGWLAPSRVLRLTWREYASSSTSSRPTVFGLTSWPQALSSHASFSRLLETHVSGRIGSPIVAGSTRRVRSPSSVLSVAVTVGRPPPARRTRPGSSAGPSRSFRPRMIRDRASPVIAATPATPPHPAARASLAAKKPNSEYARLYAAAVARRQADQIYNLSLTRTATVILGQGARRVIGVGRVKTPTLAIVCKRELEIRNFVPIAYFDVVATAKVARGQFQMRHAPQEWIVRREIAQDVVNAARDFEGALTVRVEDKRQGPPKLHDLPSLQKLCGSRFGWPAIKTLEVAQELYDGQGKKIITYPRAEVRYLPQSLISDVPRIVAGLRVGQSFGAIPEPEPPVIRKGASGAGGCEP